MLFSAYLCLEQLPDSIKEQNGIKVGASVPRFDLTRMAGSLPGLEDICNRKGQCVMFLQQARGIIHSTAGRQADCFLMAKNSLNFSSIYLLNRTTEGAPWVGYGHFPPQKTYGKDNRENPLYQNRQDGVIFIVSNDWKRIEVLVSLAGRFVVAGEAGAINRGKMAEEIEVIREASESFFPYGVDIPKLW